MNGKFIENKEIFNNHKRFHTLLFAAVTVILKRMMWIGKRNWENNWNIYKIQQQQSASNKSY